MTCTDVIAEVRRKLQDFIAQYPDTLPLASAIIAEARSVLGDSTSPYRVSDTTMLQFVNDGQREIVRRVPWLLWTIAGASRTYADAATTGDQLFVPIRFAPAMVFYVTHRNNQMQASDKFNEAQSKQQFQQFEAAIATSVQRWYNSDLLTSLNEIMLDLWNSRSHLRVKSDGTFGSYAPVAVSDTVPSDTLCIPDDGRMAVVAGVVYQSLQDGYTQAVQGKAALQWREQYHELKQQL